MFPEYIRSLPRQIRLWVTPNIRSFIDEKQPRLWFLSLTGGLAVTIAAIIFRELIGIVQLAWLRDSSENVISAARKVPWYMVVFAPAVGGLVVGFIGRMVAQKDPLRFVEAVRLAAAQVPKLRAVMMGDGPAMARVREQAAGAPITLLGWCDAPSLIRGLDVLCVTSRYEALPYSFLEALHAGVPIVSTAVGGVEETIIDGQTGLVLPVDAPAAEIAEALIAVLSNAELRRAYSTASRDLAAQRTVESMTRATLDIYRRGPVASRPSLQPAVRLQR